MEILVINGSPKGKYSITYQSCLYLEKLYPEHNFSVLHVGQQLRKYEKDMKDAVEALNKAELILFSYPVYTFLAPYQLQRFIELIKSSNVQLEGKIASQISTSKHFYDITAHRYIEDNCADMGLHYIRGLSADMEDLRNEQGQKELKGFFAYVLYSIEKGLFESPSVSASSKGIEYVSCVQEQPHKEGKELVIVADLSEESDSLSALVDDFQKAFPYKTRLVNIHTYPFSGGCLSCFHCAGKGECIYKDEFDSFLREQIQYADGIVYAFSAKDHSMGSRFKLYDDRQFCNGHRTVTAGKPIGYLVDGCLQQEENLRTVLQGRSEVGRNFLCGMASNRDAILSMAQRFDYALSTAYLPPANFYGVGGTKIFRDLIYLMQGLMKADHKYYKQHGIYDFPQKRLGTILSMKLVGQLMNNPKLMQKAGNKINDGMIAPYKRVLEALDKQLS